MRALLTLDRAPVQTAEPECHIIECLLISHLDAQRHGPIVDPITAIMN